MAIRGQLISADFGNFISNSYQSDGLDQYAQWTTIQSSTRFIVNESDVTKIFLPEGLVVLSIELFATAIYNSAFDSDEGHIELRLNGSEIFRPPLYTTISDSRTMVSYTKHVYSLPSPSSSTDFIQLFATRSSTDVWSSSYVSLCLS